MWKKPKSDRPEPTEETKPEVVAEVPKVLADEPPTEETPKEEMKTDEPEAHKVSVKDENEEQSAKPESNQETDAQPVPRDHPDYVGLDINDPKHGNLTDEERQASSRS